MSLCCWSDGYVFFSRWGKKGAQLMWTLYKIFLCGDLLEKNKTEANLHWNLFVSLVIFRTSKALPLNIKRVMLNKVQALVDLVLSVSFERKNPSSSSFSLTVRLMRCWHLRPLRNYLCWGWSVILARLLRSVLRTSENPTCSALRVPLGVIGWPCINAGSNLCLEEGWWILKVHLSRNLC